MTGSSSMDISLTGVWWSWLEFRRGKKPSREILRFEEELFENLMILCADLNTGRYRHGEYTHRIINEKKRRDIYVASVRDRVVHRMMYDCLLPVFEPTFDYDVWNCRLGKGLHACLEREKELTRRYEFGYVWRADIKKFFDNVLQEVLVGCLERRALDGKVLGLCQEIVMSYSTGGGA